MRTELTLPSFLILYSALEIKQKKTGSKSLGFKDPVRLKFASWASSIQEPI